VAVLVSELVDVVAVLVSELVDVVAVLVSELVDVVAVLVSELVDVVAVLVSELVGVGRQVFTQYTYLTCLLRSLVKAKSTPIPLPEPVGQV
jgi:phage-related protein